MKEEHTTEEVEANSHKAEMVNRPKNANPTTIKMPETHKKSLAEGGAIMSDQADKTTSSNANVVANLATIRQSVGRRKVSRLSQADNLPTTPQI